jgi:hypothetical protein
MRALIVYESMFGSTRRIGQAIGSGLRPAYQVGLVGIEDAPGDLGVVEPDVSLLIVGAPSHLFGLSTPKSRITAGKRAEHPTATADLGLREWLDALPQVARPRDVLAYETRLRVRGMPGSAARSAARRMRKLGYRLLWPPQSFYVANLTGTLVEGELERARMWGRWLSTGARPVDTYVDPAA